MSRIEIIWTKHAEDRQKEWERKLGITRKEAEQVAENPEQIVEGDRGTFVAQSRRREGLLRVPYAEVEGKRKLLTVYWTSRVSKYWRGK